LNPHAVNLLAAHSKKDILEKPFSYFLPNLEPLTRQFNLASRANRTNGCLQLEAQIKRLDEQSIAVDLTVSSILYQNHQALLIIAKEVEQQKKKTRDQLVEHLNRYRLLARHATDIISKLLPSGEMTYISPACMQLLGYSPNEMTGQIIFKFVPPEDQEHLKAALQRLQSDEQSHTIRYRLIQKNQQSLWVETNFKAISNPPTGQVSEIVAVTRDISDRKQVEEFLRVSQQRYEELFNEAPVMYVTSYPKNGELYIKNCNRLFLETLGYSREEVLNQPMLKFYTEASARRCMEGGFQRALTGQFATEERELVKKDGSVIPALLRALPEFDAAGEVIGTRAMYVDISELKKAYQALQESEQRFRDLVETAPETIFSLDSRYGRFTSLNSSFEESTGWKREQWLGRPFIELIHPEDRELALQSYERLIKGLSLPPVELHIRCKDGHYIPCEVIAKLQKVEGRFVGILGFVRDMSFRKKAEKALRASEERFRALYEDNPSMYFTVDRQGKVLSVNKFGAAQLGYEPRELVGKSILDLYLPGDRDSVKQQIENCRKNPEKIFTWKFRKTRKDGSVVWVKETARTILETNDNPVIFIVCENITKRKLAEDRLRESEKRFRSFFENAPDIYLILTPSGIINDLNQRGLKHFGFARNDILNHPFIEFIHPEDVDTAQAALTKILATQQPPQSIEIRMVNKQGEYFWVNQEFSLICDEENHVKSIFVVSRDITENKRLHQELARAQRLETAGRM
ncbi:MAG: PAS domain S-box protein, partial [Calditrichaeota bacterium]